MEETKLLDNLRKTIEQDPTYFIKAKTDINLNRNPKIEKLLNRIYLNASDIAKKSIEMAEAVLDNFPQDLLEDVSEAVSNAERAFRVSGGKGSVHSRTMYEKVKKEIESTKTKLDFAKEKVASRDYIAFLEAKQIADEAHILANELANHANSAISQAYSERKNYQELRSKKVNNAIFASPGAIIKNVILGGIIGMFGGIYTLGLIFWALTGNEHFPPIIPIVGALIGIGIGLYIAMGDIREKLK